MRLNRDRVSRETTVLSAYSGLMPNIRGLDDFPDSVVAGWPSDLKDAYRRRARAGAALRLYQRRGWNDSAVRFQFDRERAFVKSLEDKYRFEHDNPALF